MATSPVVGAITGPPADPPRLPDQALPVGTSPAPGPAGFSRRRIAVLLASIVVALVAVGLAAVYRQSSGTAEVQLSLVHGELALDIEVDEGTTVAEVIDELQVLPTDGRLLSISGAVLDQGVDPARILIDGREVSLTSPVVRSARRIEVVDGTDAVEGTRTVDAEIPVPDGPDVIRHVEERGAPGVSRQTVGEVSGEVASTETVVAARPPARTERKVVALTFDDGPSASWTPYVLEILRSRGVKATFCMVGTAVERNPDLARQVVAEGHQVCNHTHGHDLGLAGADAGADRVSGQLGGGRSAMVEHGLPEPAFYRPPGGNLSDLVVSTARSQGERVLMWKVDTKDWQSRSSIDSVMRNLREQVEPGAVILMHDGGGSNRFTSVAVLAGMIDELRAQGYEFTFPVIDPA